MFRLRNGPAIEEEVAVAFVLDFFLGGGGSSSEASSVKSIGEFERLRGFEMVFFGDGIWGKKEDIMSC